MPKEERPKQAMRIHSFRLEAETLDKLDQMAQKERLSLNTVVARQLRMMTEFSELSERMGVVGIARTSLIKVMDFLDDKQAEQWGRHAAQGSAREFELAYYGKETLQGFLVLLHMGEEYTKSYTLTHSVKSDSSVFLTINHTWGRKWSIYYYGSIDERLRGLTEIGEVKKHSINYTDNQITATIIPTKPLTDAQVVSATA